MDEFENLVQGFVKPANEKCIHWVAFCALEGSYDVFNIFGKDCSLLDVRSGEKFAQK